MSLYSMLHGYKFGNPDKDLSYEENLTDEDRKVILMIGLLAVNIRNDWGSGVDGRLDAIKELCLIVKHDDWIEQIDNNIDDIRYDGRWMRDIWDGPYESLSDRCTPNLVGDDLYDKYYDLLTCQDSYSDDV